jgi:chromate reductase
VRIHLNAPILSRPDVLITAAHTKFDSKVRLTHEETRDHLRDLRAALKARAERLRR